MSDWAQLADLPSLRYSTLSKELASMKRSIMGCFHINIFDLCIRKGWLNYSHIFVFHMVTKFGGLVLILSSMKFMTKCTIKVLTFSSERMKIRRRASYFKYYPRCCPAPEPSDSQRLWPFAKWQLTNFIFSLPMSKHRETSVHMDYL